MQGMIERHLSPEMAHLMMALQFGMTALAVITLYWAICDYVEDRRHPKKAPPRLYYPAKASMAIAILFFMPSRLLQLAVLQIDITVVAVMTMVGMFLVCAYFILMQTVKHLYSGENKRTAWLRTVPLVVATLLLMGLGATVNVQL